jgi:hypothetical protein
MRIVQDTMPSGPVANTDEEAPQGGNSFSSVMIAKMTHYIQTVEEDQPLMMSWVNQMVELQQHATSHRKVLQQSVESMRQTMAATGLEPPPPPPAKPGKHGKREKLASELKASDGCDRRVVIPPFPVDGSSESGFHRRTGRDFRHLSHPAGDVPRASRGNVQGVGAHDRCLSVAQLIAQC